MTVKDNSWKFDKLDLATKIKILEGQEEDAKDRKTVAEEVGLHAIAGLFEEIEVSAAQALNDLYVQRAREERKKK